MPLALSPPPRDDSTRCRTGDKEPPPEARFAAPLALPPAFAASLPPGKYAGDVKSPASSRL